MDFKNSLMRTLLLESKGSFIIDEKELEAKKISLLNYLKFDVEDSRLTTTVVERRKNFNATLAREIQSSYNIEKLIMALEENAKDKMHIMFYSSNYTKTHGIDTAKEVEDFNHDYIYYLPSKMKYEDENPKIFWGMPEVPIRAEKGKFKIFEYIDYDQTKKQFAQINVAKIGAPEHARTHNFMLNDDVKRYFEEYISERKKDLKNSREEYFRFLKMHDVK